LPGTAIIRVLDRGFDPFLSADSQDALVIDFGVMITFQIISDSSVSFIRTFVVNLLDQISDSLILCRSCTKVSLEPLIVRRTRYVKDLASWLYGVAKFLNTILNGLV